MIKIKKLLILCVLISIIIAHWVLWASAGYPAYALRVPLDTDSQRLSEAMVAERMKTQLAGLIAGITGMPDAEVTKELNLLTTPVLRQAWLKRFNLNSKFFKDQFVNLWTRGAQNKQSALSLLAKGCITVQRLGPRGECKISFNDTKLRKFADELPLSLRGMTIYQGFKKNNSTVSVEWAWVPGLDKWLPVQADFAMLKTLFDDEGYILKIGARISRKVLKQFYEDNDSKNYKLCMRTGPEGRFSIGSEKLPSGRQRGAYEQSEETGNIVIATIGQNGVPVEFLFMGNDTPVYPKRIVTKDGNGKIELIESHLALNADVLHALTRDYGNFWVFVRTNDRKFTIGTKAISGNLAENRPLWVNKYLTPNPADDQTYALSIIHYFQLPAKETVVEVLMTGGVPAYIKRGKREVILKRLELESAPEGGSSLRDPIDSFVDDITSEALLKALAHAMQKKGNIVATRLRFIPAGKGRSSGNVAMAGQQIYIPAELVPLDSKYAEVVYNPADVAYDEATGQATPRPAEIRIGHYTTNDPDKLSKCKFETLAVFFLKEDEDSPGRFIAYQPAQLDLSNSSRRDL